MTIKSFGPEDCEVSDDEVNWRPAIGSIGRYYRIKPEIWDAFVPSHVSKFDVKFVDGLQIKR